MSRSDVTQITPSRRRLASLGILVSGATVAGSMLVAPVPSASALAVTDCSATGGTVSTTTISGVLYNVHTFLASGTFTPTTAVPVEYLLVAGGGGGGSSKNNGGSGGGGAGGVLNTVGSSTSVSSAVTVTVAAGGAGATGSGSAAGGSGTNSTFAGGITASATGGGGGGGDANGQGGVTGGSGGGGGATVLTAGSGTSGQGSAGGAGVSTGGGGGGGQSAVGTAGTANTGGTGGAGLSTTSFGTTLNVGGGGGGSAKTTAGAGATATGGGGGGINGAAAGTSGTANTGGGGGGGYNSGNGGSGGLGIAVFRYPKYCLNASRPNADTAPTVAGSSPNQVLSWTAPTFIPSGATPITYTVVFRLATGGTTWRIYARGGTALSVNVSNKTTSACQTANSGYTCPITTSPQSGNGTMVAGTYVYRVFAKASTGTFGWMSVVSASVVIS